MFFFFFEQISRFDMENYSRIRNTGNNIVKFRISLITKRGFVSLSTLITDRVNSIWPPTLLRVMLIIDASV